MVWEHRAARQGLERPAGEYWPKLRRSSKYKRNIAPGQEILFIGNRSNLDAEFQGSLRQELFAIGIDKDHFELVFSQIGLIEQKA